MSAWIFLMLACLFAYLAFDASKLAVPWRDLPYSVIAKGVGQDVSHIPLSEQAKLKQRNADFGFGDLSGAVWLWSVLAVGCVGLSIYAFYA